MVISIAYLYTQNANIIFFILDTLSRTQYTQQSLYGKEHQSRYIACIIRWIVIDCWSLWTVNTLFQYFTVAMCYSGYTVDCITSLVCTIALKSYSFKIKIFVLFRKMHLISFSTKCIFVYHYLFNLYLFIYPLFYVYWHLFLIIGWFSFLFTRHCYQTLSWGTMKYTCSHAKYF